MSALLLSMTLTACAAAPRHAPLADAVPMLRLPPAALSAPLALQQRLTFSFDGRTDRVDALIEADARSLRLLFHVATQPVLRIEWDGTTLREERGAGLPPMIDAQRVVSDLQLAYWPADAIRAVLPRRWRLLEAPNRRELRLGRTRVTRIDYAGEHDLVLSNELAHYRLDVRSAPLVP